MVGFPYAVKCEIAFSSSFGSATWSDMTSRLISFRCNVGQQYDADAPQPGQSELVLDNSDGVLDPDNPSGPYYGSFLLNRLARVSVQQTSLTTLNPLCHGFVDSWTRTFGLAHSVTTAAVTDQTKYFARATTTALAVASGSAVSHLSALCSAVGVGGYTGLTFAAKTYDGGQWDMINDVVAADGGLFYLAATGTPTYLASNYQTSATRATTSQETFAFGLSSGTEVVDTSMSPIMDDRLLANAVTVFDSALAPHTASSSLSQARHGVVPYQLNTDLTSASAATRATALINQRATPTPRVDALTIDALTGSQQLADALTLQMGDRVTLLYQGLGDPVAITRDYWIHGIAHDVSFESPQWLTTYSLAPTY